MCRRNFRPPDGYPKSNFPCAAAASRPPQFTTHLMSDMESTRFANHFLIAMPNLADPNFSHTVTLVCEHNEKGALGIVINRPTDLTLTDLVEHLEIEQGMPVPEDVTVYSGGPVQMDHGFVLHQPLGSWESTLAIDTDLGLTTSRDIITATVSGNGPERQLIALGYAGWAPGQLEREIADNAWLTVPNDPDIVFSLPSSKRWHAAAGKLGIDLNLIDGSAGHA